MKAPIVFVSHASEDKAFVVPLGERLRSDGVDAWVDNWEIAVGDSLVDKIFSDGIGQCDAFLIVLSQISITKPWVREELNAGMVEAIERKAKILSIKLDDCDVPVVLKSRKWLRIDRGSYESEYRELLGAIFGHQNKPPLGTVPNLIAQQIAGFSPDESRVLRLLVEVAAASDGLAQVDAAYALATLSGLDPQAIRDAIEMLSSDGMISVQWFLGRNFMARVSPRGWVEYAGKLLGFDVDTDLRLILSAVASDGACNGNVLSTKTGLNVCHLVLGVKYLEQVGHLHVDYALGGPLVGMYSIRCTPQGRRAARQ